MITSSAFAGKRYDCGSKTGFVEATLALALERPDMGEEVRAMAERLLARLQREADQGAGFGLLAALGKREDAVERVPELLQRRRQVLSLLRIAVQRRVLRLPRQRVRWARRVAVVPAAMAVTVATVVTAAAATGGG